MKIDSYDVIGVMSGTSLDGIDLAHIEFHYSEKWHYRIKQAETFKYSNEWFEKLKNSYALNPAELKQLDIDYTLYLGDQINKFISLYNIQNLDAICSHGHTVLHQPEHGLTLQIGNSKMLAEITKNDVVCDFRVQDVEFGGQGAPLVPIGDELLFSEYDMCINLGGFANISMNRKGKRIAFDICPLNIMLNELARNLGHDYDEDGNLAKEGEIDESLLFKLDLLPYYNLAPPKSLGIEWVKKHITPLITSTNHLNNIRTFTEHVAVQISQVINDHQGKLILLTGGGAKNKFLINNIKNKTQAQLIVPDSQLLDYKEALIFGLLGVLKIREEINCLSSVTGAIKDHSSGQFFVP